LSAQLLVLAGTAAAQAGPDVDDPDLPAFSHVDRAEYVKRRAQHDAIRRGYEPGKPFDPSRRIAPLNRLQTAPENDRLRLLTPATTGWTPIGPAPIPNGQTNLIDNPVSGRVTAIDVHPTNPNIAYVGTAQGGLYRTLDGGTTWTALMDTAQSLAIGA